MKICLVHEEYPNETNFGGIATYQKIVAEHFSNQGDEVIVIARGKEDREYYENGVHIFRIKSENDANNIRSTKEYRKKVAKKLIELQNNNQIDIIETPDWGANTIYFEKERKVPLTIRLHTPLKIWLNYNNNNFGLSKDLILKWENKMLKNADSITSCSELLKDMVLKEYKVNKNITVINNPCNNKDFYKIKNNDNDNNNIIFVGSLEERKGTIVFAKALNLVLDKIPNNNIIIIGKDTNRNNKNISTKEYMLKIINKKYHDRIKFIGQIDNNEINEYLGKAKLAINPSLFDNFPYVILEEMLAGKYVICSDNIGTTELIKDKNFIFKSGDYVDLSNKILKFYKQNNKYINEDNIELINKNCNPDYICKSLKDNYIKTIKEYNKKKSEYNQITNVLKTEINFNNIKCFKKINNNIANEVFIITTDVGKYVIKKYNYDYDFELCKELYTIYEKNKINIVKPINNKIINLYNNKYNIFKFINNKRKNITDDEIIKLIKIKRNTSKESNLIEKCDKYYNYLKKISNKNIKEEENIIKKYEKIKSNELFKEQFINHGDLTKKNILFSNNKNYIIDFDETVVTTELYDFAVMMIKLKTKNNKIKIKDINGIIDKIKRDNIYQKKDYIIVIKMYLCKILLEKFYLYETGKIDLYDRKQKKDSYKKYTRLLKDIERLEE